MCDQLFVGRFGAGILPAGPSPSAGELFRFPDQARTLEAIAASSGEAFYRGELATAMIADAQRHGAFMTEQDLADHAAHWEDTISTEYHGTELHEIPPSGQGLAALMALGILRQHPAAEASSDSADGVHLQIEAMKLAFADVYRYCADPDFMDLDTTALLDDGYLGERASLIDMRGAGAPSFGRPQPGGTVMLTTADRNGMMVSLIQSDYHGFGSGIVVPSTGISLQNRAVGFTLEEGHPNQVGGGKRPFHTIIPAFLTRAAQPQMSFGLMGGDITPVSPFPWSQLYAEQVEGRPTRNYYHWLGLTYVITLTTNPALSLPCGTDASGMPFGLQVVGRHRGDARLLDCAQSMEGAFAGIVGLGRPRPDPRLLTHPVPELQSLVTAPPPDDLRRDDNR